MAPAISSAQQPSTFDGHLNRGEELVKRKEHDKAISDYNQAIRLNPKYSVTYSYRWWAWGQKKGDSEAIADYNELRTHH